MTKALHSTRVVLIISAVSTLHGCAPVKTYRLNPEVEPAEFRIVCGNKSAVCRSQAAEVCDSEYEVISQSSNFAEPDPDAPEMSQAPTTPGEWQGELHVRCSGGPPPLSLKRPPTAETAVPLQAPPEQVPPSAPQQVPPPQPRVCVPGTTQPCLGPGACSGAQSCTSDGVGFSPCDCGPAPAGSSGQEGSPPPATSGVMPAP